MAKNNLILAGTVLLGLGLGFSVGSLVLNQPQKEEIALDQKVKVSPSATLAPVCTRYINEEYGFSVCYPIDWTLPQEGKIEPPQQHLYQIVLNPSGQRYFVNVYDRRAPVALGSFIRDYFKETEVNEIKDLEVNGQEALQFYIPETAGAPRGIGGVAFAKGNNILTITTSSKMPPEGDFNKFLEEEALTGLVDSFRWLD